MDLKSIIAAILLMGLGFLALHQRRQIKALTLALDPLLEQQQLMAETRAKQITEAVNVYQSAHGCIFEQPDGVWVVKQPNLRFLPIDCAMSLLLENESEVHLAVICHDPEGYPMLVRRQD